MKSGRGWFWNVLGVFYGVFIFFIFFNKIMFCWFFGMVFSLSLDVFVFLGGGIVELEEGSYGMLRVVLFDCL